MTLVDTSAWIEFFRGRAPYAQAVDDLLAANAVAICGPVLTELRRGLLPGERNKVLPLLGACRLLDQPDDLWTEAGELGFLLARRGVTTRTFELLIATYALAHAVPVLTRDRDFEAIARAGTGLLVAAP